jgi:hypothetical protein
MQTFCQWPKPVPAGEGCSNILPPWVISGRAYTIPPQGSEPNVSMGWHVYFDRLFFNKYINMIVIGICMIYNRVGW